MIPLPYKLAIVGVALVGTFFVGREHGLQKYYDYKSAVEKEQSLLRAEADRVRREMDQVTLDISQSWNRALDWHRNNPRVIRVQPSTCQGLLPTLPTSAQGLDATAEARTIDPAQCEAYLNAGIADAVQLMHLQQFMIDQHEAAK